jgi:hypothetical protein
MRRVKWAEEDQKPSHSSSSGDESSSEQEQAPSQPDLPSKKDRSDGNEPLIQQTEEPADETEKIE